MSTIDRHPRAGDDAIAAIITGRKAVALFSPSPGAKPNCAHVRTIGRPLIFNAPPTLCHPIFTDPGIPHPLRAASRPGRFARDGRTLGGHSPDHPSTPVPVEAPLMDIAVPIMKAHAFAGFVATAGVFPYAPTFSHGGAGTHSPATCPPRALVACLNKSNTRTRHPCAGFAPTACVVPPEL